jgi:hypothetical protein
MPSTLLYGQQRQQDAIQALIEALRQPTGASLLGQQQSAAQQQSAGSGVSDAMGTMGTQLTDATKKLDLGQYFGARGAATDFVNGWTPENYG